MTNEEEREERDFLCECRGVQQRGGLDSYAVELLKLAERLLKENSELRVRDSNVTFHSLNVMAVNEDLVGRKCGTCKHWEDPGNHTRHDFYKEGKGVHKICKKIDLIQLAPKDNEPLAFTQDASGYSAVLWTAPVFGCVLWEKKS